MKPKTNRFTRACKIFLLLIFITLAGFLNCFSTGAQVKISTSTDSIYYVYSNEEWNSEMCENVEKILLVLNKESAHMTTDSGRYLVRMMKSPSKESIQTGIRLKPYLMIFKSEIDYYDFLKETKEEELKIEEWMYSPKHWTVNESN